MHDRLREILSLALFAAGFFLAAALLTYREVLPPADPPAMANVCGAVGSFVAGTLLHRFGFASWVVVALLLQQGQRMFRKSEEVVSWARLPGLVLFTTVLATFLTHLFSGATTHIPDPGGDVGIALQSLLIDQAGLGSVGGPLTLLFLLATTFVLASGMLYSESWAEVSAWWDQRGGFAGIWSVDARTAAEPSPVVSGHATPAVLEEEDEEEEWEGDEDEDAGVEQEWDEDAEWEDEEAEEEGEGEVAAGEDDDESLPWEADAEVEVDVEGDEDEGLPWEADDEEDVEAEEEDEVGLEVDEDEDEDESSDEIIEFDLRDEPEDALADDSELEEELDLPRAESAGFLEEGVSAAPPPYQMPPVDLLSAAEIPDAADLERSTSETARKLTQVLASFKVDARVVGVQRGPSIKMFEVELAAGTKLGRLRGLEDDLAMGLAAKSVRIVAPIPNRSTAGIEIPNDEREAVTLRDLLEWSRYNDRKYALPFFLGKGSAGQPLVADLAKMPHLLVAGATGAGKSVCLNTMIMSFLYKRSPDQVQMILIDPKMVELSLFQNIPHLMCPVVTDMKRAAGILEWAVEKMEARYQLLHEVGVRNIQSYNRLGPEGVKERLGEEFSQQIEGHLPYIVIVIDELADLMMTCAKDVESSITRLAQKSRAVGIHVVLATQRPSTNVITGLIKANLPTRIAFRVSSKIDSRVILDANGAERLLGAGDMLYLPPGGSDLVRVQGAFVDDDEIHEVMEFVASQGKPRYSRELMQKRSKSDQDPSEVDELFDDAAHFVVTTKRGSASLLQRRYQIGYTRASRLIDLMAAEGYLGDYRGSQAREVLVTPEELEKRRTEALARLGKKPDSGPTLYDEQEDDG